MGAPWTAGAPGRRRDAVAVGAVFTILLAAYVMTACPTVFTSVEVVDSGELITAIHVLGVSHPTGYPLYMLLGRAFEAIVPVGSVAYRLNLLSALFGAAAGALICWGIVLAGASRPAGVLGGLSGGLFSTVWGQSNCAEVWVLNMLLVALMWVAFCHWQRTRTSRALVWLAAAAGLGLAHHRTSLFVSAPLLVAALVLHRPLGWKIVAKGLLAFLAPLLLYVYLPLRAAANPPANWGDCATWGGFWRHVGGAHYTRYLFARQGPELSEWLQAAAHTARAQIGLAGLAFAFLGGVRMIVSQRRRALGICLALSFALTFAWSATYAAPNSTVYLIVCYLILGWWLAAAADGVGRALERLARGSVRLARAGASVAPALMIVFPVVLAAVNWRESNKRGEWYGDEWAQTVFAQFLPKSLVLLTGDSANGIAEYFQVVKGMRRDVTIYSADHASYEWYTQRIPDRRLREAVGDAIRVRKREVLDWRGGRLTQLPQWLDTLGYVIATEYPQRLPMHTGFPVPDLPAGYDVEDRSRPFAPLFTITTSPPHLLEADPPGSRPLGLEYGISLLGARAGRAPAERGRAVAIWLSWRCEQRLESRVGMAVSLVLDDALRAMNPPPPPVIPRGIPWGFSATTAFMFGLTPLQPTPPGQHYAQDVWVVPPRGLLPGRYVIRVAVAGEGWQAGPVAAGEVEVR